MREGLRLVFQSRVDKVEEELKEWLSWASRSKLSRKIRRRKEDIIVTVKYGLSNARIESMNDKIKVLILKSYVFRNTQNLIDMLMIVCFGLYY
ncbi:transposase [Thomasclavelia cocleata]|uniref:transposase n=1 Tax=Thomasclavelia cocleata TaxID=69824 RepID=UPI0032E8D1EE